MEPETNKAISVRNKVGILLVHGIGQQREGETLQAACDGIVGWLKAQTQFRVSVESCILKPSLRGARIPANAVIRVVQGDTATDLYLAESWWANEFDAPPASEVARWLLTSGSWLLIQSIAKVLMNAAKRTPGLRGSDARPLYLGFFLGVPTSVAIVLPVQLAIVLALALAWVPVPILQRLSSRISVLISQVIGDSYIFARNAVANEAVRTRICDDMLWVKRWSRTKCQILMAHSQGAALVFSLLRDGTLLQDGEKEIAGAKVITFGAGIRKLVELREMGHGKYAVERAIAGSQWVWTTLLLLYGASGVEWRYIAGWILLYCFVYTVLWMGAFAERDDSADAPTAASEHPAKSSKTVPEEVKALSKKVDWVDLFASDDLVPAGPLIDGLGYEEKWSTEDRFRCSRVTNEGFVLTDHTTYWTSGGDFIPKALSWVNHWANSGWEVPKADVPKQQAPRVQWTARLIAFVTMGRLRKEVPHDEVPKAEGVFKDIFPDAEARRGRVLWRTRVRWTVLLIALVTVGWLWRVWFPFLFSLAPYVWSTQSTSESFLRHLARPITLVTVLVAGVVFHVAAAAAVLKLINGWIWKRWDREAAKKDRGLRARAILTLYFLMYWSSVVVAVSMAVFIILNRSYARLVCLLRDYIGIIGLDTVAGIYGLALLAILVLGLVLLWEKVVWPLVARRNSAKSP